MHVAHRLGVAVEDCAHHGGRISHASGRQQPAVPNHRNSTTATPRWSCDAPLVRRRISSAGPIPCYHRGNASHATVGQLQSRCNCNLL
eukprot:353361-Chlamydomonas_euryale.AAC.6